MSKIIIAFLLFFVVLFAPIFGQGVDYTRFLNREFPASIINCIVLNNPFVDVRLIQNIGEDKIIVRHKVTATFRNKNESEWMANLVSFDTDFKADTLFINIKYPYKELESMNSPVSFATKIERMFYPVEAESVMITKKSPFHLNSAIFIELPKPVYLRINSLISGIEIDDFDGEIDINSKYTLFQSAGKFRGKLSFDTHVSEISMKDFDGEMAVSSDISDVTLCGEMLGSIDINSKKCQLVWLVDKGQMDLAKISVDSGLVSIAGLLADKTFISMDEGMVKIEPLFPIAETLSVKNTNGDITLQIKDNTARRIDCVSEDAIIIFDGIKRKSPFSYTLSGENGIIKLWSKSGAIMVVKKE